MARVCVFCATSGRPLTREHIYPDWLSTRFKKGLVATNEVKSDTASRLWEKAIFQDTVNVVCAECNNGWMSAIESDTKDVLADLIFSVKALSLDEATQQRIALWVQKTVLILNKATGGDFKIPNTFYHDLYSKQKPLPGIMVTMGWRMLAKGTKDEPLATFEIKQIPGMVTDKQSATVIKQEIADGKLAWSASLGLGRVVFQLFGHNMGGTLEVGGNDERVFPQINPFVKDLEWPTEWPIEALGTLDEIRSGM